MHNQKRVTRPFILLIAFAVLCPHAAAQPRLSHDSIHRVIELWLDRRDDDASQLIAEVLADHRSVDAETRATLQNLDARIHGLEARQAMSGRPRTEMLERAEYNAALAVRAVPTSLSFWRDYLTLAIEARGHARVADTLDGSWKYGGHVPRMYMFQSAEHLAIGNATLHLLDGRQGAAIMQLRSFLAQRRRNHCSARVVLSQILYEAGQVDTAIDTMSLADPTCRENPFVSHFESTLADAKDAQSEDVETIAFEPGLPKSITVWGERPDDHRADLENVILQNPARLDRWYALWEMLHKFGDAKLIREYQKVIDLSRRVRPAVEIDVADVHGQLGRGEFRNALEMSTRLLEKRDDPDLHAVRLLCGAALGDGVPDYLRDLDVVDRKPSIASCLRREQVEYCLARDERCVRGAMVRRRAHQFSAAAFRRGWPIQAPNDMTAYMEWAVDEEAAERLDGMARLREEMLALDRTREEQLAALYSRIDLILIPELNALKERVAADEIDTAELKAEMKRNRARTNAELKQLADAIETGMAIMHRESALTRDQVRALSLRVATNYKALMAIDVNRFADLFERYIEARPKEAAILHFNIVNQVGKAAGSDNDIAVMAPAILDECARKQAPSAPCLRAVVKMVKKHLDVQIPLLPIPGILSLDVLGIGDTLLELWDYLDRKLGLVPRADPLL